MECHSALELIPGYLDGELSDAQAGPLRSHLMGCPACRARAQDQRALSGWFAAEVPVEVPEGFAARVARRAFAGDTGEVLEPAGGPRLVGSSSHGQPHAASIHRFLLHATAVAAALLFVLSIALRGADQPSDRSLFAEQHVSKERLLDELEAMQQAAEDEADSRDEAPDGE